jgi:hypothetical protein
LRQQQLWSLLLLLLRLWPVVVGRECVLGG